MAAQLTEGSPRWACPYRSAKPWAVVATILFALTIAYSALLIAVAQGFLSSLAGTYLGDLINLGLTGGGVLLAVLDAIGFLLWFRLCYRNLPALGAQHLEWSPRSAVLWWFVPLAAWVVPLRVTAEIWKGSDPSIDPNTPSSRKAGAYPTLLMAWWVAWLGNVLTGGVRRLATDPGVFTLLTLLPIVAAVLGIAVIWRIQQFQDRRGGHE